MSFDQVVTAAVNTSKGGWSNSTARKLKGGLVGSVDYSKGEDKKILATCEAWISEQLAKLDRSAEGPLGEVFGDGVALAGDGSAEATECEQVEVPAKLASALVKFPSCPKRDRSLVGVQIIRLTRSNAGAPLQWEQLR